MEDTTVTRQPLEVRPLPDIWLFPLQNATYLELNLLILDNSFTAVLGRSHTSLKHPHTYYIREGGGWNFV